MRHPRLPLLLLFIAAAAFGQTMTWQDANRQSAELIRTGGDLLKAGDLAYKAFQLYGEQSPRYNAANHAQLLLNAVSARVAAGRPDEAVRELDHGIDAIANLTSTNPVLISLCEEGRRISTTSTQLEHYFESEARFATMVWGEQDERTLNLQVSWARSQANVHGAKWTREKLEAARAQAAKASASPALASNIELAFAQVEAAEQHYDAAISLYRQLLDKLDASADPGMRTLQEVAYSGLARTYAAMHDDTAAAELDKRMAAKLDLTRPQFVSRVPPVYPPAALRDHVSGYVLMELSVDKEGNVSDARVLESVPGNIFDATALTAIRQWKLRPRLAAGKPVAFTALQELQFKMSQ